MLLPSYCVCVWRKWQNYSFTNGFERENSRQSFHLFIMLKIENDKNDLIVRCFCIIKMIKTTERGLLSSNFQKYVWYNFNRIDICFAGFQRKCFLCFRWSPFKEDYTPKCTNRHKCVMKNSLKNGRQLWFSTYHAFHRRHPMSIWLLIFAVGFSSRFAHVNIYFGKTHFSMFWFGRSNSILAGNAN